MSEHGGYMIVHDGDPKAHILCYVRTCPNMPREFITEAHVWTWILMSEHGGDLRMHVPCCIR